MFDRIRRRLDALAPQAGAPPRLADAAAGQELHARLERFFVDDPARYRELFLKGRATAVPPALRATLDACADAGLTRRGPLGAAVPCVRLFPFDGAFVATDLASYDREDQVFELMLEQVYMVRHMDVRPGDRVLELCVGSAVNALFASDRAASVVGVDVSPRALAFAAFNVALNPCACAVELRRGSLWEPLEPDATFDVVLVNPPFELVPPGTPHFLHSAAGEDGLDVVRALLPELPRRLRPGGRADLVTWTPETADGPVLARLLAERFPGRHVELHVIDDQSLDVRIDRFAARPGFAAWRSRLHAQGIVRVPLVWARVHPDPGPVEVLGPGADREECFDLSQTWR